MLKVLKNSNWGFQYRAGKKSYVARALSEKGPGVFLGCSHSYSPYFSKPGVGFEILDESFSRLRQVKKGVFLHPVEEEVFDEQIMLIRVSTGFEPIARGAKVFRLNPKREDFLVVRFEHPEGYLALRSGDGISGCVVTWAGGIEKVGDLSMYREMWKVSHKKRETEAAFGFVHQRNGNGHFPDRRVAQLAGK